MQQVQRRTAIPDTLILLFRQGLLQHPLIILRPPLQSSSAQSVLNQFLHLDWVDLETELHEISLLELEFLLNLVGAEVVEAEGVGGEVDAGVGGMVHEDFTLDLRQSAHCILEGDALMEILLEASGHNIQQFRRITIPLLDVDEIIENLSSIEALERCGKDHGVDVDSQEVDISMLLQLPQLFTGMLLEFVLTLGNELHDLERSGVLHVEASADVAIIRVPLDEGRVEVGYLDLLVVEEDVLGTKVSMDDPTQL